MREEVHPGLNLHQSSVCKKASQRKNTLKNVCSVISTRPLGSFTNSAGDLLRQNMDILRKLVCQKNTIFQNVWTKHSKSSISYAKGRIYFDNFRCCFNSIPTKPHQIYEMPRCSKLEKIEDALLCEGPVGESLPQKSDYTPSLIAVTGHNWLLRLSAHTGETLEKVYLGSYRKFRYFAWDLPQETLVLKSIQRKATTMQQETGSHGAVLFYLAVFSVYPFALLGIMEINKDIFGSNVTDAMISHGMLIVMHSVGLVRIYSFEKIAEQIDDILLYNITSADSFQYWFGYLLYVDGCLSYMQQKLIIGHSCSWKGETGTVGQYPFGIPCNITFTESPPFLFEVSCQDNAFQVGGFPWHYIITPNKKKDKGCFHVRSLDDHSLAKNGILDMKCCSLEPDWIHFHPDASERIIHVGPNQINVLRLKELQNDSHSHQVVEDFVILASRERQVNNLVTKTASGRLVKKRFSLLDDDPEQETFKIVTYEDELDLLTVVAVTQTEAEGKAHVDLHCNETGKILKKIPLLESWDVTFSHAVFFDRDTLVHIEERPNRHFSCYVYKMQRNFAE